jgi:ATP-dependent DNA helicase RecG
MSEDQNTEYKQTWNDEYLKWIVGFANGQGGILYIGKDDEGKVLHVPDYEKLLEDLPNKIRDILGIIVEVNHHEEDGSHYLQIVIPPYTVPISLKGVYYTRSGSTKQELKGNALMEFLLRKTGKTWDDVIEPAATLDDISTDAVGAFVKAAEKCNRLNDLRELSLQELLEKLRLSENGGIKRAAIVLFGKDPGRFSPNMVVKLGRFGSSDEDLKFQETEEGNIIYLLGEVANQLNRKFFTKPVDFEGLQRIERGEYPVAAIREMLLNALVHRDYMGSMVQIRIYDDRFSIWNEGYLPQGLTLEALKRQHPSRPRNPLIADVCFKGGYIDAWGRGTLKIINACNEAGLPEPEMKEQDGGMLVTLFRDMLTEDRLRKKGFSERQVKAILYVKENRRISNAEYQKLFGVARNTASIELKKLVETGFLKSSGAKGAGAFYTLP